MIYFINHDLKQESQIDNFYENITRPAPVNILVRGNHCSGDLETDSPE